jgi:hypothetical protein
MPSGDPTSRLEEKRMKISIGYIGGIHLDSTFANFLVESHFAVHKSRLTPYFQENNIRYTTGMNFTFGAQ